MAGSSTISRVAESVANIHMTNDVKINVNIQDFLKYGKSHMLLLGPPPVRAAPPDGANVASEGAAVPFNEIPFLHVLR
jgi:hypothetical protein